MTGEKYTERGREISLFFIDSEIAFGWIKLVKLVGILKEKRVDRKERKLIMVLCTKQKAATKVKETLSNWLELSKGMRQC